MRQEPRTDQAVVRPDTPGLLTRPPVLYLSALLIGLALDRLVGLPVSLAGPRLAYWIGGAALVLAGFVLARASIGNFSRAGTPYRSIKPSTALVTTGLYSLSRNPIYVGLFLIYGGVGIAAQSLWTLVMVVPLAAAIRYGIVAREEAYLEERFGDAFRDYKARVRRWL